MKLSRLLIVVLFLTTSIGIITIIGAPSVKTAWNVLLHGPYLLKLPEPTGPYSVGTVSYRWVDETRKETFIKDSQSPRELMVQFWYPSDAKKDGALFPYSADKKEETKQRWKNESPFIPSSLWDRMLNNQVYAIPDAVLSSAKTNYPVLIFSPGYGMSRDEYAIFTEDLASHGYIVVGIDHPYISGLTVFPDGRTVNTDMSALLNPKIKSEEKDRIHMQNIMLCKADIEFVINKLAAITNNASEKSMFYTKLDMARMGAFGHSFGGMAAMKTLFTNAQIKASANFDGWAKEAFLSDKNIEKPCMYIEHGYQPELTESDLKEEGLSQEDFNHIVQDQAKSIANFFQNNNYGYHLIIKNLGHMGFSDLILTKKSIATSLQLDVGPAEPYKTIRIMNNYIRTFFDKYLNNEKITASELCNLHPEDVIVKKCGNELITT